MNSNKSLYVQILLWAHDRTVDGFDETDLIENFKLKDGNGDLYKWYLQVFRNDASNSPLIVPFHYDSKQNKHWSCLSDKGMSASINYLLLKEAQNSGNRGEYLARWAIGIAIIVGMVQITLSVVQICLQTSC